MIDVYIQPSKFEGLEISVVEAHCNGLPVFISKHVPDEVIFNNKVTIINKMNTPQWVDQINSSNRARTLVVYSKYNVIKASKLLQYFYDYVTKKMLPL